MQPGYKMHLPTAQVYNYLKFLARVVFCGSKICSTKGERSQIPLMNYIKYIKCLSTFYRGDINTNIRQHIELQAILTPVVLSHNQM